jgi:hypothetical protein
VKLGRQELDVMTPREQCVAACVQNLADELKDCVSGCVRTGIADINRLLSDNFEISSYKEDKHFIQDLRLSLSLLKIQAFLHVMLVVW